MVADSVLFHLCRSKLRTERNGMECNTLGCEWVTLVTGGIYDFGSGLKKCLDVDLFGSFVYLQGIWEKV